MHAYFFPKSFSGDIPSYISLTHSTPLDNFPLRPTWLYDSQLSCVSYSVFIRSFIHWLSHYYFLKRYMWSHIFQLPSSSTYKRFICLGTFHISLPQILNQKPPTLLCFSAPSTKLSCPSQWMSQKPNVIFEWQHFLCWLHQQTYSLTWLFLNYYGHLNSDQYSSTNLLLLKSVFLGFKKQLSQILFNICKKLVFFLGR